MPQFSFDFDAFAANGGTQADLDALALRVRGRRWFNLATPSPRLPHCTSTEQDQLPARVTTGEIEIDRFFRQLMLFATEEQEKRGVSSDKIFAHLQDAALPVLGWNVGNFLFGHQFLIPQDVRPYTLVFAHVHRDRARRRVFPALAWKGRSWISHVCAVDGGIFGGSSKIVLLNG